MEVLLFIFIGIVIWSIFTIGRIAFSSPVTLLFAFIGIGFLFGDDDCDI